MAHFGEGLRVAGGELEDARDVGLRAGLDRLPEIARGTHVFSAIPEVAARGVGVTAARPHDLAELDVALVRARCGVAENGAVWHAPADRLERAAALLAEHLVVVLDAEAIVPRLFDAYAQLGDAAALHFGWFICGPSKTADIEQALVLGAHGPRRASVLLV